MFKNPTIDTTAVHPEPITIASAIAVDRSAATNAHVKNTNEHDDEHKHNIDLPEAQVRTVPPRIILKSDIPSVNVDQPYGSTLKLFYILSIVASIWIFSNAHPKYELDYWGNKRVSSHFQPQVKQCCNDLDSYYSGDVGDYSSDGGNYYDVDDQFRRDSGLCSLLNDGTRDKGRRMEELSPKFLGDEGIFDAFLYRPDIIIYLSALIISFTLIWVYSLQKFAKQIVICTEALKIMALAAVALLLSPSNILGLLPIVAVAAYGTYVYNRKEDIMKAADVITHSAILLKHNTNMAFNLAGLKVVYCLQTAILLITMCTSYEIVEVRSYSGSCYYGSPAYLKYINTFQVFVWIWTVWTFDMVRLFIVASITGTNYFHPNEVERRPKFSSELSRALGKSFGTLALGGIVTSFLDILRKRNRRCYFWFGPQVFILMVIEVILCFFGACLLNMAYIFTKFSVVLHSFTGRSLQDSGQQCHEIMRRRFVGGFITEITSQSVLWFSSIIFSISTSLISWGWMDAAFDCNSFANWNVIPIVIGLIVFHPVVGVILVICVNISMQNTELYRYENGQETFQSLWIPPLAAAFIGVVTKLFFNFLCNIVLDTIDTMIMCFAIDEDNGVERRSEEGFAVIVKGMKEYIKADPITHYDIEADHVKKSSATSVTSTVMTSPYVEQRRIPESSLR